MMKRNFHIHRSLPFLPTEILMQVVNELGSLAHPLAFRLPRQTHKTLLSLTLTSKAFCEWAEPILYRYISISFSQVPLLTNTLHYHQGNYRPQKKYLSRRVTSLRVTRDMHTDKGDERYLTGELCLLLDEVRPTLQHLCLHVPTNISFREFLDKGVSQTLTTCILTPIDSGGIPMQTGCAQYVALACSFPFTIPGTFRNVRQVILWNLDWQEFSSESADSIVQLAVGCPELKRILLVPLVINKITPTDSPPYLLQVILRLNCKFVMVPYEIRQVCRKKVQFPILPANLFGACLWMWQKLYEGSVWDLEGMSYFKMTHGEVTG